jgi:hypothetical protein
VGDPRSQFDRVMQPTHDLDAKLREQAARIMFTS